MGEGETGRRGDWEIMMDEIGVAVVGTGWVAGEHIKSFHKIPGCKVVALCNRTGGGRPRQGGRDGRDRR